MGRAQSDTYSSLFTKSDNVNLDETFDRKSALVHVLIYRVVTPPCDMKKAKITPNIINYRRGYLSGGRTNNI